MPMLQTNRTISYAMPIDFLCIMYLLNNALYKKLIGIIGLYWLSNRYK